MAMSLLLHRTRAPRRPCRTNSLRPIKLSLRSSKKLVRAAGRSDVDQGSGASAEPQMISDLSDDGVSLRSSLKFHTLTSNFQPGLQEGSDAAEIASSDSRVSSDAGDIGVGGAGTGAGSEPARATGGAIQIGEDGFRYRRVFRGRRGYAARDPKRRDHGCAIYRQDDSYQQI